MTNITAQYVSTVMPGQDTPQLVKRMHYMSYVGLFRSDLFEGLCVGHAPRKCPICGRWFLTTDARQTKYCGGLAPNDKNGRPAVRSAICEVGLNGNSQTIIPSKRSIHAA